MSESKRAPLVSKSVDRFSLVETIPYKEQSNGSIVTVAGGRTVSTGGNSSRSPEIRIKTIKPVLIYDKSPGVVDLIASD